MLNATGRSFSSSAGGITSQLGLGVSGTSASNLESIVSPTATNIGGNGTNQLTQSGALTTITSTTTLITVITSTIANS